MTRYRFAPTCAVLMMLLPVVGMAGTITVSVGYADDLRPSPFFPNPWSGSANVALFAGMASGIDAGAVRLTNNTGAAITIDSITVDVPTSGGIHNLWGGFLPFVLPNGKDAIFTQTAQFNFDTSDSGFPGLNAMNNCDPGNPFAIANPTICASIAPSVTMQINGISKTFIDSGHVLDTGGFDFVNANPCPVANDTPGTCNESLQWRSIGTSGIGDPGGNQVPEPATVPLVAGGGLLLAAIGRICLRK